MYSILWWLFQIQFTEDMEAEMKAGKVVPKHLPAVSADAVPVNPPPPQMNHAQRNNYNQHKRGRDGEPYKFFSIEVDCQVLLWTGWRNGPLFFDKKMSIVYLCK